MDPLTQVKLGKNFAALVGLGCISKQTMHSTMKITRLNSSKDNFLMKSFPSSTKRELSILLNFLFLFNSVFLTLKCRTLGLIPPHGDRMVAILLKMDILHLKVGVLNASYTFQPLMSFWYSWYYYIHFEITGDPCNLFGSQLSFRLIHVLNCCISVLNCNTIWFLLYIKSFLCQKQNEF